MPDDRITVGFAADISDFTSGIAQTGAVADETFGRIHAITNQRLHGIAETVQVIQVLYLPLPSLPSLRG